MDTSGADDGTDFRPFFDMVIGILFVLLILVAAQVYFQQAQDETAASEAAKREAALRRADISAFLDALASRLREEGLDATADAEAGAIVIPLHEVLNVDHAGLPSLGGDLAEKLGTTLTDYTTCVTQPRSVAPVCSDFTRLGLDALAVTLRVGGLPPGTALPRDRFGDLASVLLSAKLLGENPVLIGASNAVGGRIVTFRTAAASRDGTEPGVGGDLELDLSFQ